MGVLFIANIELNENEGILKKILAQAQGLKKALGGGILLTRVGNSTQVRNLNTGDSEIVNKKILDTAKEMMKSNLYKYVYIRHMIPNIALLRLLRFCSKEKVKIFYEIPTYPYFAEQLRTSNKKYRALIKISIDILFFPFIYYYISHLVVIVSNSKIKLMRKMTPISNGADVLQIAPKDYKKVNCDKFSMVAVGTLYPYHGYDRILEGLRKCNEKVHGIPVEFNVVGSSETINQLKEKCQKLELKNVKFLGIKNTQELNKLYDSFDIGLGCLALYRRNADIDTTIKIIEYYCRGIPVVTSGLSPMDAFDDEVTIHIDNTDSYIDIEDIYNKFLNISDSKKKSISKNSKERFSWDNIMKDLLKKTDN